MQNMPQVQAAADTGCRQKPNSSPVATTSSMMTYDADRRVWAYCRSSSRSKAGRVPEVDVNRSGLAHPLRCDAAGINRHCDWLIGGFTHQTTRILPAGPASFCIVYLWR